MMKNTQAGNYWPWRCEEITGKAGASCTCAFHGILALSTAGKPILLDTRFALTGTADRSNHSMTIPFLLPQ
jgi:hypothetical protein